LSITPYTNNAIYTVVRNAVKAQYSGANVTQTYAPTPSQFPTVFVREIGRLTPPQTAVLSNVQDISETTWEAQVFTNLTSGAKEQAHSIIALVKSAFRSLYFVETFESPLDQTDKSIYCLVARFRRIVGSGEDMPTTNT